ncbi:substrate-binding domain-containing protein [Streptomyces fagopyri]|uniref:hypothetical protein n=1 Tax=Streptomyces fagopyri TaxID=2662397 RepID=UPI00381E5195
MLRQYVEQRVDAVIHRRVDELFHHAHRQGLLPGPPELLSEITRGMDLRRLRAGEIDAALVGSTMAPEAVAAQYGWNVLAWMGDHIRIPTVGLTVDTTHTDPDGPAVQAVLRAHRRALKVIHEDPETTVRHMRTFLGGQTADEARTHYDTHIAPHFTTDGQVDLAIGEAAISAVAAELGVPSTVTAAEFHRTTPAAPQGLVP